MLASPLPLSCTPNHGMLKEWLGLIHSKHLPMCVQDMHLYMDVLKPTTVFFIVYDILYLTAHSCEVRNMFRTVMESVGGCITNLCE